MTSPMNSSGMKTSTRMIGSSSTGLRLAHAVLERHRAGDVERLLRRVDVVVRAVDQRDLDVDHRVAGEDAVVSASRDALLDRGDVLPRDRAADDLVDELEALAGLVRLDLELDVAVLAVAAGLADEAPCPCASCVIVSR